MEGMFGSEKQTRQTSSARQRRFTCNCERVFSVFFFLWLTLTFQSQELLFFFLFSEGVAALGPFRNGLCYPPLARLSVVCLEEAKVARGWGVALR